MNPAPILNLAEVSRDLQLEHAVLKEQAKALAKQIADLEAMAIRDGFAERRADHTRETAPNKADFIAVLGQEAWDATCTRTVIRKFTWL